MTSPFIPHADVQAAHKRLASLPRTRHSLLGPDVMSQKEAEMEKRRKRSHAFNQRQKAAG